MFTTSPEFCFSFLYIFKIVIQVWDLDFRTRHTVTTIHLGMTLVVMIKTVSIDIVDIVQ